MGHHLYHGLKQLSTLKISPDNFNAMRLVRAIPHDQTVEIVFEVMDGDLKVAEIKSSAQAELVAAS